MKKILFILLLILSLAPVFADISFGGNIVGNWMVVENKSSRDPDYNTDFYLYNGGGANSSVRGKLNVTAVNEANTFGGWIQFRALTSTTTNFRMSTKVWWQPLSALKITYGYLWGGANPIGVNLADYEVLDIKYYGRSANYIPFGYEILNGAHIELTPTENLYIVGSVPLDNAGNLSYNHWNTPYTAANGDISAEDIFKHTMARIAYTIPGTGTARLTFAGGTGRVSESIDMTKINSDNGFTNGVHAPSLDTVDVSVFDIGFTLSSLENLTLDMGFEFPLQGNAWLKEPDPSVDINAQVPIAVNLRANASHGNFNFAGGVSGKFGGKYTIDNEQDYKFEQGFILGFTLNPTYDAGILIAGIVGELEFNTKDKVIRKGFDDYIYDPKVNWSVIPYIQKNVFSGGTVYAGFQLFSNLTKSDSSSVDRFKWKQGFGWSIPIGLIYSF
ncbi:MAG: hypothetical protein LBK66_00950 [Spirochaetaceae bacterium]|nr:hypothetical protein [Spirochaetaceae bacterium]